MRMTIADRFKALFANDEYDYWFKHFTDEEKKLRRMDSWELAKVIQEETGSTGDSSKRIVAEHLLQVRLVKLQNRATYIGIVFGLLGIVIGAFLNKLLQ
ncbi:hypothetical protein [Thiomicrorhabdus chilensis]|uniref:hypothetical protein n=1 Tax=Thiomicrorhabdus chilensis TaxID=63656 RepID=UPI00040E867E|nr:hypothetical protein [Thiomicrorhabdus chilensis]